MIRVAAIGDTHADETRRWDEHERVMDWCVGDFDERQIDLVCHTGDVFEGVSTPLEREYVADWTQRVARNRPIAFVAGNHDRPKDVEFLSRLRSDRLIYAFERPATHPINVRYGNGVVVAALPWPRKSHLLASIGRAVTPEESSQAASDALRSILSGMADELDAWPHSPTVLIAHAMIDGARTNHDQPLVGADMNVSAADLALSRASIAFVGHVHCQQDWNVGMPVVYTGSPLHQNWGEFGPTGYVMAEFEDDGRFIQWYRVPTPARQMLLTEMEYKRWDNGESLLPVGGDEHPFKREQLPGAEVRVRYNTANEHRDHARRAAQSVREGLIQLGAHSVKLEERVISVARVRAPEIARARTTADKLEAYWNAKNVLPEPKRRERLLAKLGELETIGGQT